MIRRNDRGLPTYEFESAAFEGLVHSVFTRLGGVSRGPYATLNVGNGVGDDESAVAENHTRIYSYLEIEASRVSTSFQVHGNRVAVVDRSDAGKPQGNTDGLVTAAPNLALFLRFADCQPILLFDPNRHAVGLVHAGWRGVAQAIARRAVETMHEEYGSRPEDLVVGLGPAIGPCCYVVGQDVAASMGYALPDWERVMTAENGAWRFDLTGANAQQLQAAGVRQIERAEICTACRHDEFFSHRADNGLTGRFAVVVHLAPGGRERVGSNHHTVTKSGGSLSQPDISSLNPPGFPAMGNLPGSDQ